MCPVRGIAETAEEEVACSTAYGRAGFVRRDYERELVVLLLNVFGLNLENSAFPGLLKHREQDARFSGGAWE